MLLLSCPQVRLARNNMEHSGSADLRSFFAQHLMACYAQQNLELESGELDVWLSPDDFARCDYSGIWRDEVFIFILFFQSNMNFPFDFPDIFREFLFIYASPPLPRNPLIRSPAISTTRTPARCRRQSCCKSIPRSRWSSSGWACACCTTRRFTRI